MRLGKVSIVHVDTDPKWGYMVTGGSWSIFHTYKPMSQAGAAGRMVLIDAGAKLLGVPADSCKAEKGFVISGNKKISYGDIVANGKVDKTFSADELAELPIKPGKKRHLIGVNATTKHSTSRLKLTVLRYTALMWKWKTCFMHAQSDSLWQYSNKCRRQ